MKRDVTQVVFVEIRINDECSQEELAVFKDILDKAASKVLKAAVADYADTKLVVDWYETKNKQNKRGVGNVNN